MGFTEIYSVFNVVSCLIFHLDFFTVPTAPPQNVAIQSATATQLDVTWEPPPLDSQNGDIQGYKVKRRVSQGWSYHRIVII